MALLASTSRFCVDELNVFTMSHKSSKRKGQTVSRVSKQPRMSDTFAKLDTVISDKETGRELELPGGLFSGLKEHRKINRFLQYLICICDRIQILFVFVCFTGTLSSSMLL